MVVWTVEGGTMSLLGKMSKTLAEAVSEWNPGCADVLDMNAPCTSRLRTAVLVGNPLCHSMPCELLES